MAHELHEVGPCGHGNKQMQVIRHEAVGKHACITPLRGFTQGFKTEANRVSVGEMRSTASSSEGQGEAMSLPVCW